MDQEKIKDILQKCNIQDEKDLERILKLATTNIDKNSYKERHLPIEDDEVVFGVMSDLHIGHKCYRPDILRHAIKNFKQNGVKFVVNTGDTIEGMSGRDGHIYELSHVGASQQFEYFREEFKLFEEANLQVYSIEAANSHSGWYTSKSNMGLDVGKEMDMTCPSYKFLGYDDIDLVLSDRIRIKLVHPGGGTAYAVSYKMQKHVNGLQGGHKPNIMIQGHYHKANYMFYRNVHCIDAGCLENQTSFMKKQGSPAHVGYWIVRFTCHGSTITSFTPTFIPFYD